jgi:hypothetical protein
MTTTIVLVVCAILILVTRTAWFTGLFLKYGPDEENKDEDDQEYLEEMD